MASIHDVARLSGTSKSTVSRVMTGNANVTPEVKNRVLAVIRDLGFVPNQAARNMVLRRSYTVGLVLPDTFNMFQRQLFAHLERHLERLGYHTDFFFEKWGTHGEPSFLRRLKAEKLDGLIVAHEVEHHSLYDYLRQTGLPTVLCTFSRGNEFPAVTADDHQGALHAVNHLLTLGHRRIGLLRGGGCGFGELRRKGWSLALEAVGLEAGLADEAIVDAYTPAWGHLGMERLLAGARDLTAVFAATDELALGALRHLHEAGIAVPRQISVVGFDDIDIARFFTPSLTTIRQSTEDLGRHTAETLQALIEGRPVERRPVVLGHQLIRRESTAPVSTPLPS